MAAATGKKEIFRINSVSPSLIQIEVIDISEFKRAKAGSISIGTYLKVSDENKFAVIALIKGYRIKDPDIVSSQNDQRSFIIDAEPVGFIDQDGKFKRGGQQIAIPPQDVEVASKTDLERIYSSVEKEKEFSFSNLVQDSSIRVKIDGDKFFSKHIGVVGSTGSGKSCTVAKLLQAGIDGSPEQKKKGILNNSHIVVFDLHSEYGAAFPNAPQLTVENIVLPCWLLNAEELQELFIESQEENSHNQVSQFRQAVILNKRKHNPGLEKIAYDTPVYFNVFEVFNYISNLNNEMISKVKDEGFPKLADKTLIKKREDHYFEKVHEFVPPSQAAADKATGGPFHGDFNRFVMRLEGILQDERLSFLVSPKMNGNEPKTKDFENIVRQFVGYDKANKSNVTIMDLSGIPFEVLSVVVSLISRIIFDFFLNYKPLKQKDTEVPVLLVYEEAHNYAPRSEEARFKAVKKSIERIAKEGRKYGLSLMIVSQRPSEISETIFSQCNNFVAMRLTNPTDQAYVTRLLPDVIKSITDNLPVLEKREALIIGDSISLPTLVCIDKIENKPASIDVDFQTEWKKDWVDLEFNKVIEQII
jgi:DNA helicase HerA-like ATPase